MRLLPLVAGLALACAPLLAAADEIAEPAGAAIAPQKSTAEIASCMDQNRQHRGSIRVITLDSVDKEGRPKVVKVRATWSSAGNGAGRLNLRVLEPPVLYGSSYL